MSLEPPPATPCDFDEAFLADLPYSPEVLFFDRLLDVWSCPHTRARSARFSPNAVLARAQMRALARGGGRPRSQLERP